ncbi:hypothetical protein JCM9279_006814 [Rhodotorula babjevae]
MFGETYSESPRLPSPWLSRSSGGTTPSPLALATPDSSRSPSSASTATSSSSSPGRRRRSSLEEIELLDGLAEDFDVLSLARGATAKLAPVHEPALEEITVREVGMETLEPEVDHQGHIEYKLKLLTPTSLHRLEKLRTQLKWRLVEGGGVAVYELGVLDDGTLVGLVQDDMDESLRTLGQMLAGLGGGLVQVTRVVRLDCGDGSSSSSSSSAPASPGALFSSFDVPFDTDDLAFVTSSSALSSTPPPQLATDPVTGAISIFPPARLRGPAPIPNNRTPDEQAEMRRLKRDARRQLRREAYSTPAHGPSPAHAHGPLSPPFVVPFQVAHPPPVQPRHKPPKPPKPPRVRGRKKREAEPGSGEGPSASGSSSTSPASGGDSPHALAVVTPASSARALVGAQHAARPARAARAGHAPKSPHGGDSLYKPALLKVGDTEVRYVVEAVVTKAATSSSMTAAGGGGAWRGAESRRRRKSSAAARADKEALIGLELFDAREGDEHDEEDADEDGEESEDDTLDVASEGWSFLEFDLEQLASSVKSAAATAAAAAEVGPGGRAAPARAAAVGA